jgi:hypothetical protein
VIEDILLPYQHHMEKANYAKNPGGCYDAAWPNTCGHYINITDKENKGYKTMACGVYVTTSGAPYVVLNFFT